MHTRYLSGLNVLKSYKTTDFYKSLLLLHLCVYRGNRMAKGLRILLSANRIHTELLQNYSG